MSSSTFIRQERAFYSVNVGSNVTLPCFYLRGVVMLYWFKQTLGQKPTAIATLYKHYENGSFHNEYKNNPRFVLERGQGENHLKISDLQASDSAIYYCVAIDAHKFEFGDGATVIVEGSGSKVHTLAHQTESETNQTPGCVVETGSCHGEGSFYWFRDAKEHQPGIIYTQSNRTKRTSTCEYSLPLNVSDIGTHRCAVASCGHIIFEDKSNKKSTGELNPELVLLCLSGALAFILILNASMAFSVYRIRKTIQSHCRANSHVAPADPDTVDSEEYQDEYSVQYSAVRQQRFNGARRQRDDIEDKCVYASVKQGKSPTEKPSTAK
uniref:Uncharacterized LOC107094595 n=2 Tax=Cyprinodon variegatus TaxID=28743 RepID=A0A3Q2DN46_CYPVA